MSRLVRRKWEQELIERNETCASHAICQYEWWCMQELSVTVKSKWDTSSSSLCWSCSFLWHNINKIIETLLVTTHKVGVEMNADKA